MYYWGDIMKCKKVKNGDYVTRKSHGEDILFNVEKIIKLSNGKENAILKGVTYRIKADAPIEDLCIIDKKEAINIIKQCETRALKSAKELEEKSKRNKTQIKTGIILHLDGDTHLSNPKKHRNINTSKQVIFSHNRNNVSKNKIHYFFGIRRD